MTRIIVLFQILSNDRGYTINPEKIPTLQQHAINVGIRLMGKHNPPIDHKPFKGLKTKFRYINIGYFNKNHQI